MIKDKLANKVKIPGFGHRVYHTVDPRAASLKEWRSWASGPPRRTLSDLARDREVHQRSQESERQRGFLFGFDLLFTGDSGGSVHADFRCKPHVRLDGAHPEQYANNRLIRPRAEYLSGGGAEVDSVWGGEPAPGRPPVYDLGYFRTIWMRLPRGWPIAASLWTSRFHLDARVVKR